MAFTLADQYYLKALNEYPWNLEVSIENLNYALSYDEEHIEALCLMGKLYMEQLCDTEQAEEYIIQAMAIDSNRFKTCAQYAYLTLDMKEFHKTKRILKHMRTIQVTNTSVLLHIEALLQENKKSYSKSLKLLKSARIESLSDSYRRFLKNEISRVKDKKKDSKKKQNR